MIARILRPLFTVRRSLLVLGVAVGGLAFPAASMAATYTVGTAPIHKGKQGFLLRVLIQQGTPTGYGGRYPNAVTSTLVKKSDSGHATETDVYTLTGAQSHCKFTTGKKALQFAMITCKASNGDGSIKMAFHAKGKPAHVNVPKGCTSDTGARSGTKRSGTIGGSYLLKADKLGTITQKSFKATLSNISWTCNAASHGYELQTLSGNPFVDVFMGPKGKVAETIADSGGSRGSVSWTFTHTFVVRDLPSSVFTLDKAKLSKATVKGAGGISGSASYSSSHSSSRSTLGKASGSLAVTMASIGKVKAFPKARSAKLSHS